MMLVRSLTRNRMRRKGAEEAAHVEAVPNGTYHSDGDAAVPNEEDDSGEVAAKELEVRQTFERRIMELFIDGLDVSYTIRAC